MQLPQTQNKSNFMKKTGFLFSFDQLNRSHYWQQYNAVKRHLLISPPKKCNQNSQNSCREFQFQQKSFLVSSISLNFVLLFFVAIFKQSNAQMIQLSVWFHKND